MGIVSEKLLAEYGKASIELEIAQNKFNNIKEEIVKVINTPNPEVKPVKESIVEEKKVKGDK